jgi:CRP/FNR family transcriptional regulator
MSDSMQLQDWQAPAVCFSPTVVTVGHACDNMTRLMQLLGADGHDWRAHGSQVQITVQRVGAGTSLYLEGAKARAIYIVQAGTFKTFRSTDDGYEQVVGFAGRSDVLGFDALSLGHHPTCAVALDESSVYVLSLTDLYSLAERAPALDHTLRMAMSSQLQRFADLVELKSAVSAEARLGRFLLQYAQKMMAQGQSSRRLYLRMSRRDIASYLGITHETVSRAFTNLARAHYVTVARREVEILDIDGLKACARSTRRSFQVPRLEASH